MRIQRLLLAVAMVLAGAFMSVSAAANACKTADPRKVGDVYNCLAQSPQATMAVGQAGTTPMGCMTIKMMYIDALKHAGVDDDSKVAGCRVLAGALKEFNGKAPLWEQCVDYDASEKHFNRCMSGAVLTQSNAQQRTPAANCPGVLQMYSLIVNSVIDNPKTQRFDKSKVSCAMVDKVLAKNNVAMYARECLGYKPDSTDHISRCIGNDAEIIQSAAGRLDCDSARAVYLKKLIIASSGQPPNYQIPRCSTLEPVVASINAKFAQLSQPGAAPVAVQNPAPALARTATTQPAVQQSVDPGATSRRRQAAGTQAAAPVPVAPVAQPVQQVQTVNQSAATGQPQTKVDQKLDKVNQGVEKSTNAVNETTNAVNQTTNAVNETVEQSKKLFNLFKKKE